MSLLTYLCEHFPDAIHHETLVKSIHKLEAIANKAALLEYGKYGTRHLGSMLALSHAREYQLRSAFESIRDQSLNYVEIADIAKSALTIPAPPVVLKETHDAVVAELNKRLMERQETLIEKGAECEKMRKALARSTMDRLGWP